MSGACWLLLATVLSREVPPEPQDPEVLKAKAQIEEGNASGARETLERAIERLQVAAPRTRELAIALYYDGVLEADGGTNDPAKELFRRALTIEPDLAVPGDAHPKAKAVFEATRKEIRGPGARPAVWKGALIAGAVLGGAIVALAAAGGSQQATTPNTLTQTYTGAISSGAPPQMFPVIVGTTGIVTATGKS